ncbi:MAG: MBL fold metallo-hydrolase [Deltaproteobacteria bacterium]|nr:MBL fold metallo-hydrolase [Deltaproteobacteria bacterium]
MTSYALLFLSLLVPAVVAAEGVTLRPMITAEFKADYSDLVQGGEERPVWIPVASYLIQHPQNLILFDTGFGTRIEQEIRGWWLNRLLQLIMPYRFTTEETAVEELRKNGIPPTSIKTIILSHLHYDHTGGLRDFPKAQVILPRAEWERAQVGRWGGRLQGIMKEHLEGVNLWPLDYQPGTRYGPFEASYDLMGDSSVLLLSTPGHTPGHQSVLVKLGSGQQVLLTGDAVWVEENYTRPSPKGWKARLIEEEDQEAWRTTLQIRKFHEEHPEVLIIPGHDPKILYALPAQLN